VQAFAHDATHAASVRILTLPNATHFVHLDRAQHGRDSWTKSLHSSPIGNAESKEVDHPSPRPGGGGLP
jgi:hypothetical protein